MEVDRYSSQASQGRRTQLSEVDWPDERTGGRIDKTDSGGRTAVSEVKEVLGPGQIVRSTKELHYLFAERFSRWQEGGRGVTLRSSCGRMADTVRTVRDVPM